MRRDGRLGKKGIMWDIGRGIMTVSTAACDVYYREVS